MEDIGLPDFSAQTFATAVSRDGLMIAGYTYSDDAFGAARWTEETGWVGLGLLQRYAGADPEETLPTGMTADGSTIVGRTLNGGGFIWTESAGIRYFEDFLMTDYGLGAEDFYYGPPTAISPDGRYIITEYENSGGWLFDRDSFQPVPEPATYGLAGATLLAAAALIKRRRARCGPHKEA